MEPTEAQTEAPAVEQDQPAVDQAPAEEQATSATPDQPQTEATTEPSEDFTTFRLADVPEEHREYVEKAHKQMLSDYTRKTQEVAEQRKSAQEALELADLLRTPEGQARVFRELAELQGYQLDDDDDVDEQPDLDDLPLEEQLAARIEQLEQAIASREQAERTAAEQQAEEQHMAAIDQSIDEQIKALQDQHGVQLSERYSNAVVSHALAAFPPDENGMPQIHKAYEDLEAEWKERESRWAASKEAPHVSTAGQSASQVPDLDKHQDRVQWMVDQLQGAGDQT